MADLVLCEPIELYNILNQVTKLSRLTEPNYLCLLDVRSKQEYDESHVITARRVKKELDEFQAYPVEIVPGSIYLGDFRQACDPKIQKDLKIKAHVNVSMETGPFFVGNADKLLHIQIEDSLEAFIFPFLRHLCHFIDVHLELGNVVLIFSTLGISRSCGAVLAYLMHQNEQTLKKSWEHVKKCKNNVCPNRALVAQLSQWETIVLGGFITDISVPLG
ncbi:serine/threonine/tyrosine-interacting-like protein 1 isoform X3 [Myotis daubentonii]|uniref:serine/threonine/tyrosine-interacting-like protein 1 isoform X3 n=1 Tax=Myotis daubentonii TaxID=98922 RepID=UPI002873B60B|nr:serine/threonine/tyrosine-interacting-like protein 1 isoform X3 [Myotis daubentonii]